MNEDAKQNNNGFTLVEALVYSAIFSLFVGGVVSFVNVMEASRRSGQAILEVNDQGAAAMRQITRAIRNARAIGMPLQGENSAILSLEGGEGLAPTVISAGGGALYVAEGGGDPEALTNDRVEVSNVAFENLTRDATPGTVKIRYTITATYAKGISYSTDFYGSASIR